MNKIFILFLFLAISLPPSVQAADPIVFIVNSQNPITGVSTTDLKDYFLKKKKTWPDGSSVRFIDRGDSLERTFFLERFIKKSSEDLDAFWIGQKLYSGDSSPVQSASDNMTIQFVSTFKDALGYISTNTSIHDKGVKIINITDQKN